MEGEIGTIIHATHRNEDLIPAFRDELERLDTDKEYTKIIEKAKNFEELSQEDQDYLLHEGLFEALNHFAPEGCYFGAHPGDGSDFGFWEFEE